MNKITRGDIVAVDVVFEKFSAIVIDVSEDSFLLKPVDKEKGFVNERCIWIASRDVTFKQSSENKGDENESGGKRKTIREDNKRLERPSELEIKSGKSIDHF